jgi:outer membrane receptor for ferrienterochelin and colicins
MKIRSAAVAMAAAATGPQAMAQDTAVSLGQIVVTASGFEQLLADAPASITVVTREELEKGAFRDLTDALREVQGVTVTGVANEQDISIRGLPGQYTLILVDGRRQSTREARVNGSAGFEQSFIPPLSAIERIEIVRGPMSSLYGSDAMGGVINIITRRVAAAWEGSVTTSATVQENRDSGDTGQLDAYVAGPIIPNMLGLQAWGRAMGRGEDSFTGGVTGAREGDVSAKLTLTPTPDHDIALQAGFTRLRRNASGGETLAEGAADTRQEHDRIHWSLSHEGRWGPAVSTVSIQQEWGERRNYSRDAVTGRLVENPRSPEIRNTVLDAKVSAPFSLLGEHMATIGGQFSNATLTDQNPGLRDGVDREFGVDQWALFAENEWSVTDSLALTAGLRMDRHQEYGTQFSPRLYGVWRATDALTLRGGVSTGFRAPDVRSIAPGYAYTTGGSGCTYGPAGTCGVIVGDPDLEAEKSISYEIGAQWEPTHALSLGATAFWTEFKDKIANELVMDSNGDPVRWDVDPNYRLWRSYNVDDATVRGVELAATWRATDALSIRGSYTFTDSEQNSGPYRGFPLTRTPEHAASLRADWDTPVAGLSAWALATYHGEEINAGPRIGTNGTPVVINGAIGRKYDGYVQLDVGAAYALTEDVTVRAAVYNLFDQDIGATDFNTVQDGRRLWVSLTKTF